ncbi:MAG: NAD(P)/FAD-dependent oxidoreductase [Lysobacterales bacterium]|jgi:all-trans-retinol 13,14-reductase
MPPLQPSTLRIGYRYRPQRLAPSYDALVIGSGMGGLTTAALLSEMGWKVCVLEQHYTAGGYTHSFERAGYEWDVGVHYIGDVGARTRTRRLFDFLTDGKLQWAPMDEEYDRFYIGDRVFSARAGKRAFRDNLVRQFPGETMAIDRYMRLLSTVGGALPMLGAERLMKPWQRMLSAPFRKWKLPDYLFDNTWEVLSRLTHDRDLIATLCGQWGDLGLPPKRSAFLMHAMVARHYLHGGYYPVGGAWKIADDILPKIRRSGGEVFTYARVERILAEDGAVQGVEMEDGHRIGCNCVVSAVGIDNTFNDLLPGEEVRHLGYGEDLEHVRPSIGHICVYVGLNATAEELGLPRTNYWIYPSNDYDAALDAFEQDPAAPFPVVYISFPSAKDPDYLNRHPGTATVEIVAPAPYAWFERWKGTTWGKRGEDYDHFKDELGERLLRYLYERLPHLEGKVDHHEVSTPLSTEWFAGYRHGELYGLDHTPERMRQDWLGPRTRIDGLWLTGQDTLSCGVAGAMTAGLLTTTAIVGVKSITPLMKQIFGGD